MQVWLAHIAEPPPTDAGTRPFRYTLLARSLLERGHRVLQWCPTLIHATKGKRADGDQLLTVQPGYEVMLVDAGDYRRHVSVARFRFYRRFARRIEKLAASHAPPDLIVCGMPDGTVCNALLDVGAARGAAVVIDVQDLWPDIFLTVVPPVLRSALRPAIRPMEAINARAIARADALTAVSDTYLSWAQRQVPVRSRDLDRVFPLAIERPQDAPQPTAGVPPTRATCADEMLTAVYVGILAQVIDFGTVVNAWKLLRARGVRIRLLVCGAGPLEQQFKALASDLDEIRFLGWCDAEQMHEALSNAQIGLAPYSSGALQSIPNKPLEYLAHGLPVVCTLSGEMNEILSAAEAGFYYSPGDARGLAVILEALIEDGDKLSYHRDRARALYEARFEASTIYREMAAHLEAVVLRKAETRMAHKTRAPEAIPA